MVNKDVRPFSCSSHVSTESVHEAGILFWWISLSPSLNEGLLKNHKMMHLFFLLEFLCLRMKAKAFLVASLKMSSTFS